MSAITEIDDRLVSQLRERGMRVTPQRIVIHRELCGHSQHMTADQVLARVSDVLPGTSLPTVYSTLELLEGLGLVRRVGTGNGAVVFDSRVEPHAHTVCRGCGAMADLEGTTAPEDALTRASATGFVPDHAQLVVWGLCPECAASS
ncbi:MAG TPA: Fur family transcriptional regulator [Solirubrobacteraceae bacterium]|nr:Fur family transcriptional regulator [Solirubrobacteraceae bacterium]